jgi:hypothetical protein
MESRGKRKKLNTYTPTAGNINYTVGANETDGPWFIGVPYVWGVAVYPVKFDGQFGPSDNRRLRVVRAAVLARPFDPVRIEGGSSLSVEGLHIREQQVLRDHDDLPILDENLAPIIGKLVLAERDEHVWRRSRLFGWQQDGALRIMRKNDEPWSSVSVLSLAREVRM